MSIAAFYTPFFKEVWEKKPEIEQAFHMEEPPMSEGQPLPPPRHESYNLKVNNGYVTDKSSSAIVINYKILL